MYTDTLYFYTECLGCFLGSVSALRVDDQVAQVYLVFIEVESGDGAVVRDDETYMIIICHCADVVPEPSSMAAQAWGGELDLGDDPEAVRDEACGNPEG